MKTNAIYRVLALEEAIASLAEFKRRESGFVPGIQVLNDRQYQLFREKGELECSYHDLCRQKKRFKGYN